jgi:hypothetical protein
MPQYTLEQEKGILQFLKLTARQWVMVEEAGDKSAKYKVKICKIDTEKAIVHAHRMKKDGTLEKRQRTYRPSQIDDCF